MEVPNVMRGWFYPTTRISRCPSYHKCAACKGCQNYNKFQHICRICESRKPAGLECSLERHPDYIQWCLQELTKRMNMPMVHPDKKPGLVQGPEADQGDEFQKILEALEEFSHLGSIKETSR